MPNSLHSTFLGSPDTLLSTFETGSPVFLALENWKATRAVLTTTIQSYRSDCASLKLAFTTHVPRYHKDPPVEAVLTAINSELESLASEEAALHDMRMSLTALRNKSTTLTRINMLPPEILVEIFALSKTYCVKDDVHCFHNFAGVCAYWRQLSLNRVDLWESHVDIGPNTPDSRTDLLFKRTGDNPIHVHVSEPSVISSEVKKAVTILRPHIHRVCTLHLESPQDLSFLVNRVLDLWLNQGDSSVAKSLVIQRSNTMLLSTYTGDTLSPSEGSSFSTNAKSILDSLKKLHLQSSWFDWNRGASCNNLVDLSFSSARDTMLIPAEDVARILCSNLRSIAILKIKGLQVTHIDARWTYIPQPLRLQSLEALTLTITDMASARFLLSLIGLPGASNNLSVGLTVFDNVQCEITKFFAQAQLVHLYCSDYGYELSHLMSLLRSFHFLPNLVLRGFNLNDEMLAPGTVADPATFQQTLSSRIPSVTFVNCTVTPARLREFVSEFGIQYLQLQRCWVSTNEELSSIVSSLCELHPKLYCTVSDDDLTQELPCCTLLAY